MRQVHIARTLAEAYLVKDFLEAEGIVCSVRGEHLIGIQGEIPITTDTLPSVWAEEAQAEQARQLLQAFEEHGDGVGWTCPRCGEELEGQFTECWQCGKSRI